MPRPRQESSKALGRALEAMLAQGLSDASLSYFIEKPAVGGAAAEAVATRREISPGVRRETLDVCTGRPWSFHSESLSSPACGSMGSVEESLIWPMTS